MPDHPLAEDVTVLVTTSFVRSHPSTELIDIVLGSFSLVPGLDACRMVVVCDGCTVKPALDKPQPRKGIATLEAYEAYQEYIRTLQARFEHDDRTEVLCLPDRGGFSFAVKTGLERVRTPFVLVVQHDNTFTRAVDLEACVRILRGYPEKVKKIDLMSTTCESYATTTQGRHHLKVVPETMDGLSLVPMVYWYDKTHICSVEYYEYLFNLRYDREKYVAYIREKKAVGDLASGTTESPSVSANAEQDEAGGKNGAAGAHQQSRKYPKQDVPFEDVITLALRGGLVIKKGEFIEDCVGKKQLFDIKTFGMAEEHAKYGTWLLRDKGDEIAIKHVHGRKFHTTARREELGYMQIEYPVPAVEAAKPAEASPPQPGPPRRWRLSECLGGSRAWLCFRGAAPASEPPQEAGAAS